MSDHKKSIKNNTLIGKSNIESRIRAIVVRSCSHNERQRKQLIAGDDRLIQDVGLDSIEILRIMANVEQEFGIELPDDELRSNRFRSIDVIVDLVQGILQKKITLADSITTE